ncbi:MAG: hypothetical protein IJW53_04500 [Clostridia bacterium]|nr:hypothetical protein [Clostridia bacterium]
MKDISSIERSKDVVYGLGVNRESVYYSILFGAASITALVLLIISYAQKNTALKIYAWILLPIFLVCTVIAARYAFASKNKIYAQCGVLVIKSFFITRKFKIASIEKISAATNNKSGVTTVNVFYDKRTYNYKLKSMTKEEIAHLRRVTSRY